MLSSDEDLNESHRHHAHLMAIYPLGLLSPDRPEEKEVIDQSLKQLERLGTMFWVGYSFAWAACLYARAGLAEAALHNLRVFWTSTCSRNGFHLNGDFKRTGATAWRYRPFTLEGNLAAAEAVHEMLMQSHGGIIRIFPAVPEKWTSVSFRNLRAEGGWVVSASLTDGRMDTIRIAAAGAAGGRLKMVSPTNEIKWNLKPMLKKPFLVFNIPAGMELIGTAKNERC
jgi:alpha-L-fucosidase 2